MLEQNANINPYLIHEIWSIIQYKLIIISESQITGQINRFTMLT